MFKVGKISAAAWLCFSSARVMRQDLSGKGSPGGIQETMMSKNPSRLFTGSAASPQQVTKGTNDRNGYIGGSSRQTSDTFQRGLLVVGKTASTRSNSSSSRTGNTRRRSSNRLLLDLMKSRKGNARLGGKIGSTGKGRKVRAASATTDIVVDIQVHVVVVAATKVEPGVMKWLVQSGKGTLRVGSRTGCDTGG